MGFVQKDSLRTMLISYFGIGLGYLNKGVLFLLILSTEEIGLINLIIGVGILFGRLANLGSVFTILRFFPFFHGSERSNDGFLTFVMSILGFGIAVFSFLFVFFRPEIASWYQENSALFVDYYLWVLPVGISYAVYLSLEMYLRSFQKNILSVLVFDIGLRLLVLLSLILFWKNIISFELFVLANCLFYVIPSLCLLIYMYYLRMLKFGSLNRVSKKFKSIMYNYSLTNYLNSLGNVVVNSLDILMIAQFIGLKATGVYTTIVFLTSALKVPYNALLRISTPLVSQYWKSKDMAAMEELYKKVSSVSLVIGLGSFLLLWLNIDFLFSFLKSEFQEGIWVFFFLMMGRLLDMYFGLNGAIFTTSKKYKYDLIFTLSLIVMVFLLNWYLIPIYGIIGAAISTGLALVLYNLSRLIFVLLAYDLNPFNLKQIPIIGLGILVLFLGDVFSTFIDHSLLQCVFQVALVGLLFFLPIYVFNLEPESKSYFHNGWKYLKSKSKV